MSNFNNIIASIKEQYHEDVVLMDMIYYLNKEYRDKINLLKDNGVGYTISDYTDEELVNLKNDVLLKVCSRNIHDLIYYYNGCYYVENVSIDYDDIENEFSIIFEYMKESYENNFKPVKTSNSFYVSIDELRNPKLFKKRITEDKIRELEIRIQTLKNDLSILKRNEE